MSRPGDPDREQVTLTGTVEIITETARRVDAAGGQDFEYGYGPLEGNREPEPGEPVRWYCRATMPRKRGRKTVLWRYKGTAVAQPGQSHDRALAYAGMRLLEALGANTIAFDTSDDPEPDR
jgi:hypothetical protein